MSSKNPPNLGEKSKTKKIKAHVKSRNRIQSLISVKISLKNTFLYIKSKYLIIKPFRMPILKILRIFCLFKEYFRMTR